MSSEKNNNNEQRNWLALHLAGDKQAFAQLMQAYRKPVYSYLVRSGLDKNTRDDLFQDIFFKIHKSASQYTQANPLSPWIFTIAINTLRNHLRDNKKQSNHLSLYSQEKTELKLVNQLIDQSPSPDKQAQSNHLIQWLQQEIQNLPKAQSEALNLTVIEGLKLSEVAEILKQPLSTIKTHVRRARQSLIQAYKTNNQVTSKEIIS
jgi:RNA polymerase sigma-70 factor (ECF subfamily)